MISAAAIGTTSGAVRFSRLQGPPGGDTVQHSFHADVFVHFGPMHSMPVADDFEMPALRQQPSERFPPLWVLLHALFPCHLGQETRDKPKDGSKNFYQARNPAGVMNTAFVTPPQLFANLVSKLRDTSITEVP
jgi:hypothetical protein